MESGKEIAQESMRIRELTIDEIPEAVMEMQKLNGKSLWKNLIWYRSKNKE